MVGPPPPEWGPTDEGARRRWAACALCGAIHALRWCPNEEGEDDPVKVAFHLAEMMFNSSAASPLDL